MEESAVLLVRKNGTRDGYWEVLTGNSAAKLNTSTTIRCLSGCSGSYIDIDDCIDLAAIAGRIEVLQSGTWLGNRGVFGRDQSNCDLAETRTEQFCEEMTIPKEIVATLLLAAGGKGGVSVGGGGGGSNDDLTNWDGTKEKKGRRL